MPRFRRRDCFALFLAAALPGQAHAQETGLRTWPADGASNVNPDTQFAIAFPAPPVLGNRGLIRVYDLADNSLADTLDMSIPAGPDWRRRRPSDAPPDTTVYQEKSVGGSPAVHFHPVIIHGRIATIYLHKALRYGRRYRIRIDAGVLSPEPVEWSFTTKAQPPPATATRLVVSADGSGDFSTLQGAIDFIPDNPARRITIFIRNGNYEELVYVRNKTNLIIRGESREGVTVGYGNNSAFNPGRPRYAFTLTGVSDVQLSTFTINNHYFGQAEALMIRGQRVIVDRMNLNGSGDALQLAAGGTMYFKETRLFGDGDTILTSAAAFFDRCEIRSLGPAIWPRNPATSRGLTFKDCTFIGIRRPPPWNLQPDGSGTISKVVIARIPDNNGTNYPYAEVVLLNCKLEGYEPDAWTVQPPPWDSSNVKFYEFNSTDLRGRPVDVSKRHPVSKQLTLPKDAELIADYSRPEFVLGGWKPVVL